MFAIHFLIWMLLLLVLSSSPQQTLANKAIIVNLSIDEESPLHTTLGNISSHLFLKSKITSDSPFFSVTQNGFIQLSRRLDLEALCSEDALCCEPDKPCELTSTIVIEGARLSEFELVELHVLVKDINDHSPQFQSSSTSGQIVKISEQAQVGSLIPLGPATDADVSRENQIQRYAIHGIELQQMFELDSSALPNLHLRLIRPLDYESVKNYTGILEVCDKRNCAKQNLTVLVLDANDNKPVFVKPVYQVTIPENFSVGDTILTLEAVDKDSEPNAQMDFRIQGDVDPNLKKTFRLESSTGRLILQSRLAAHPRPEYRFSVSVSEALSSGSSQSGTGQARSLTVSDTASVIIHIQDLNDFSPVIKMISPGEGHALSIPENTGNLRICVLQITDNDLDDNGRVECRLVPTSIESGMKITDSFSLTRTENLYTLSSSRSFDAEVEPQLTVTVACTDFGNPPRSSSRDLVIQVEDLNEFAPQLEKDSYYATVTENTKSGIEVLQIVAHDQDQTAKLYYELGNEGKQYFAIDHSTGVITTLGDDPTQQNSDLDNPNSIGSISTVLDREKTEKITFPVCISDGPPITSCGISALHPDSQQQRRSMDKPGSVVHTVSAMVYVTVADENDNRPQFIAKGPFTITENQPRFTQLSGRLSALDPDEGENGLVRYSLRRAWISATGTAVPDIFQVDSEGRIRTTEVLDRELTNAYTLELVACDSASQNPLCTSINATVTVLDENDNKPEWHYPHARDKEVNISADLSPGTVVARVLAMDLDAGDNGRVVYSLIDPHRRTVFQVDNVTGEISVSKGYSEESPNAASLVNKRDSTDDSLQPTPLLPGVYRLRLRATDLGHPEQGSETWLQINVFGSEIMNNASLNFMIIVIMIAITGVISICLVVAIICVRRRSSNHSNRWTTRPHRPDSNGFRRGRSAGDGAEVSGFPLKSEYTHPFDGLGGGYMMGVSPTPSDLDTLKLAYHTNGPNSYLENGMTNGPDVSLFGWTNANSPPTIYYPSPNGMPNYDPNVNQHSSLCSIPIDPSCGPNPMGSIHMPVFNRMTPTFGSDNGSSTAVFVRHSNYNGQPSTSLGVSSSCLSFASPTSPLEQLPGSVGLLTGFNDTTLTMGTDSTSLVSPNTMRETDLCHLSGRDPLNNGPGRGSYDVGSLPPRNNYNPILLGSSNGLGCCHTSTRRSAGPAGTGAVPMGLHCELDVESADSGRGASEDDPNQMGGIGSVAGQFVHFYPSCHLPTLHHSTTAQLDNSRTANQNGVSEMDSKLPGSSSTPMENEDKPGLDWALTNGTGGGGGCGRRLKL